MVHTMHTILTYQSSTNVVHFLLENCCDTVRAPPSNWKVCVVGAMIRLMIVTSEKDFKRERAPNMLYSQTVAFGSFLQSLRRAPPNPARFASYQNHHPYAHFARQSIHPTLIAPEAAFELNHWTMLPSMSFKALKLNGIQQPQRSRRSTPFSL